MSTGGKIPRRFLAPRTFPSDTKRPFHTLIHKYPFEKVPPSELPCRGGVTTDAMGWLKCGADRTLLAPGRASTLESVRRNTHYTHKHTLTHTIYLGSGPS